MSDFKLTGILKKCSSRNSIDPDPILKIKKSCSKKRVQFNRKTTVYRFKTVGKDKEFTEGKFGFRPAYFSPKNYKKVATVGLD